MASCPKSFKKGGKTKGYALGGSTSYNEKTLAANNAMASTQSKSPTAPKKNNINSGQATVAGLSVLGTALDATQKPKEYTVGTNDYFDSMNKAENTQNQITNAVGGFGPVGQAASAAMKLYPAIGNVFAEQNAYGVSNAGNQQQNIAAYFRPGQIINSMAKDFKRGDASLKTFAKMAYGGGQLINDENKMEQAKLEYQNNLDTNKAEYDAGLAEKKSLQAAKIEEMRAARDANMDNYQFQSYITNPQLKSAEFVAPELSKYSKFLDRKTGKSYGTEGYKDGGKIKGKGTAKSDSIKAKVEPNSFVVPAEKASVAEMLREKMFGGKEGKANLKQGGGVDVKLSNGEHLFTPEETQELVAAGVDLKALAPHAEDIASYKNGGLTADKASMMLRDGMANGKKLSDAQRKYFGWIASKK